jgi:RimJ/RimL family protein N-acetyltransferase
MLLRGKKVTLRRARPADGDRAYEWLALSDLTPSVMGPPLYPELPVPTRASFDTRYPPFLFDHGNPFDGRALIIGTEHEDVGVLVYGAVRLGVGAVEMELWLAGKRFLGQGLGSEALNLACHWLHEELGIDTFVLRAARRNVRALRAFRRAGFRTVDRNAEQARQLDLARHSLDDVELLLLSLPPPPVALQADCRRTYVFFDTELTDLAQPRLISVGAVATDATEFYCEIGGWQAQQASDFVRQRVLPQLDGKPLAFAEAAQGFAAWLGQRAARQAVTVVADAAYDRWALAELLGGDSLPSGLRWQRVPLPPEMLDAVAAGLGLRHHHALDTARSLMHALMAPGSGDEPQVRSGAH